MTSSSSALVPAVAHWPGSWRCHRKEFAAFERTNGCSWRQESWCRQLVTTISGTSSRTTCTTGPTSREPFLKRGLAFSGRFSRKQALDADVLVELVPMNAMPTADQSPALAFYLCGVDQSREPGKGHGQTSSVTEFYGQCVFCHSYRFSYRHSDFNCRSIHPMSPEGCPGVRSQVYVGD